MSLKFEYLLYVIYFEYLLEYLNIRILETKIEYSKEYSHFRFNIHILESIFKYSNNLSIKYLSTEIDANHPERIRPIGERQL